MTYKTIKLILGSGIPLIGLGSLIVKEAGWVTALLLISLYILIGVMLYTLSAFKDTLNLMLETLKYHEKEINRSRKNE